MCYFSATYFQCERLTACGLAAENIRHSKNIWFHSEFSALVNLNINERTNERSNFQDFRFELTFAAASSAWTGEEPRGRGGGFGREQWGESLFDWNTSRHVLFKVYVMDIKKTRVLIHTPFGI